MRILVLNQYFHPDRSATSQLLTELCEDLAEHHDVFVVTGRPSYNPGDTTDSRGLVSKERFGRVKVARVWSTSFDRSRMPRRLTNYATYLASSVAGALSVRGPDVVVALTDPPPIGVIGAWMARTRGIPFLLVTKDIFPEVAVRLGKLRNPAVVRLLRAMSRSLFDNATAVVSIGRDMDERLLELGVPKNKIRRIQDWSDGSLVKPLAYTSPLRAELGWKGRFVVMHSGNVGLSQDLETLLGAAEILRDDPEIHFAIVGDGASKAHLQRQAAERELENIQFLPYQPKASLTESLGAADLHVIGLRRGLAGYIVPSKLYGILAAGKPFVAAVEPNSEPALVAKEHSCGLVVDPGDSKALAEAILEARGHDLAAMGRRGREAFESLYDRPLATEAYRRLLEGLARPTRGPGDPPSPARLIATTPDRP